MRRRPAAPPAIRGVSYSHTARWERISRETPDAAGLHAGSARALSEALEENRKLQGRRGKCWRQRVKRSRADRMRGGRNKFGPMYKRDPRPKAAEKSPNPSEWSIKAEHPDPYSTSPDSSLAYPYTEGCLPASPQTSPMNPTVPSLVLELLSCEPDEEQVRGKICAYLQQEQSGRGKLDKPRPFNLLCVMADQTLFSIVEWARSCIFFKELKVGDQMRLLHNCWSELLLLDHICRQVHHGRENSLLLITGQEVELAGVASESGLTLSSLVQRGQELSHRLQLLQVDRREMACLKFLILFNPNVKLLENQAFVESVQEQVNGALLEYTLSTYPQHLDRFSQLLLRLPELRALSNQAEDYLSSKHLSGDVPCNSLLIEMLHAKRATAI
ncbi:hypothetical protein SRHO_G00330240 [Serrasalmus rhombeus]